MVMQKCWGFIQLNWNHLKNLEYESKVLMYYMQSSSAMFFRFFLKYKKHCKLRYISCAELTFKLLEQAVQYACSFYKTTRDITPYESALL